MNNCYCNICGIAMHRAKPVAGFNFCSSQCRKYNEHHSKAEMQFGYVRKGRVPVGLDMEPWPLTRLSGNLNT